MADIQKKASRRNKPRSCGFLSCFGFSRKEEFSEKISVKDTSSSIKKEKSNGGWFCWPRFRKRNSFRTVPIDITEKDFDQTPQSEVHSSKSKSKCKKFYSLFFKPLHQGSKTTWFQQIPTVPKVPSDQASDQELEPALKPEPEPDPDPGPETKEIVVLPIEETRHEPEQNVVVEHRRSYERGESSKDNTDKKRLSFQQKIESIRVGSSQPVSPDNNTKRNRTAAKFLHSASFPAPKSEKGANLTSQTHARVTPKPKKSAQKDKTMVNKLDPFVGMSIVMVTLAIMLACGRLCAIMCTSAWLYVVPRFRAAANNHDRGAVMKTNGDPDLNSKEYKKRVVLEGFLERDHKDKGAL